jgi:hypothetical protein
MSNLYRGPSIDASYQVSVHMAEGFQRRRLKCEKSTDDRRRTPSDGKSSHCLWQGELKMMIIFSDINRRTEVHRGKNLTVAQGNQIFGWENIIDIAVKYFAGTLFL